MKKEKPILFSTAMVQAILEGRKTQTRRVMKPANPFYGGDKVTQGNGLWVDGYGKNDVPNNHIKDYSVSSCWIDKKKYISKYCPYGTPGTILWVRETTYLYGKWVKNGLTKTGKQKYRFEWNNTMPVFYAADSQPDYVCKNKTEIGYFKRPSIFMPFEVCRLRLGVQDTRVERVKDITEEDARAEGVNWNNGKNVGWEEKMRRSAIERFHELWDSINAKRGYGWDVNPYIWRIEYKRVEGDYIAK